mgnify:CR=1 FL=1
MFFSSQTIARLIEPTLHAVSRPTGEKLRAAHQEASAVVRAIKDNMKSQDLVVHAPSFELGAGSAFLEVLATLQERSVLGDAVRSVGETPRGIEIVHQIALVRTKDQDMGQREIAELLDIDPGNFSRYVRRLEASGVVDVLRSGKQVIYSLSMLGQDVLEQLRPGWKATNPLTNEPVTAIPDPSLSAASSLRMAIEEAMNVKSSVITKGVAGQVRDALIHSHKRRPPFRAAPEPQIISYRAEAN